MKKEYMKPEVELMRFVEEEELMTTTFTSELLGITDIPEGETWR